MYYIPVLNFNYTQTLRWSQDPFSNYGREILSSPVNSKYRVVWISEAKFAEFMLFIRREEPYPQFRLCVHFAAISACSLVFGRELGRGSSPISRPILRGSERYSFPWPSRILGIIGGFSGGEDSCVLVTKVERAEQIVVYRFCVQPHRQPRYLAL